MFILYIYCQFQVITIDRERLLSEKQNNKASAEGARLPKEAMLFRDIFKFTKPFLDAFRPFGLISKACLYINIYIYMQVGPLREVARDHCTLNFYSHMLVKPKYRTILCTTLPNFKH